MTRTYCLWLLLAFGEGSPVISELLDKFGSAENVYKAFTDNIAAVGAEHVRKAESVPLSDAETLLPELTASGINVITRESPFYPEPLRSIENPPCAIFAKGDIRILSRRLVTVVGSRAITDATYRTQAAVCSELLQRFTLVTTMSEGCDTLTCMTAIERKKPCVIVMPCGHDKIYPKGALVLREEILRAGGCIITEYLPHRVAGQGSFLRRGRLLGGISKAALITQVGAGSGALVTAGYSPAPFFLPPPDIFDKNYAGVVSAVRSGGRLYFGAADLEKAFAENSAPPVIRKTPRPAARVSKSASRPVSEKEKTSLKAAEELPREEFETDEHYAAYRAVADGSALTFDEIMYRTGVELDRLCEVLMDLEIEGRITLTAGSRYRLP